MIKDVVAVARKLEEEVQSFTDIAVIGVSGGVDSATVASICVAALGKDSVYLVSMPYDEIDTGTFNARSTALAEALGAQHYTVPVKSATDASEDALRAILGDPLQILTRANIRPRVRMNFLYSISGELGLTLKKRVRVIGTGHMSEDLIGYDTKGGDALADIFILSDLVKSEVYQLAEYYNVPNDILSATPSAGLYPGQTDQDELGYGYDELEAPTLALHAALKRGITVETVDASLPEFDGLSKELSQFVVDRYRTHFHKHEAPATITIRCPEWFE